MSSSGIVRNMMIFVNGSLFTAFPYPEVSSAHEATIKEVLQWENRIEGWLSLIIYGVPITVFDPYFYLHRGKIQEKISINFCGLAYNLEIYHPRDIEIPKKRIKEMNLPFKTVTTKGMSAIFPMGGPGKDDHSVVVPIIGVKRVDIMGKKGYIFLGPLFKKEKPFIVPIIALEKNIKGPIPQTGDDLFANIWLQGFPSNRDFKVNGTLVK